MIRHIVLYHFKSDVPKEKINALFTKLAQLKLLVKGVYDFQWGENLPFNTKNCKFSYGITVDLVDQSAVAEYSPHPLHVEVREAMAPLFESPPLMFDFTLTNKELL